MGFVEVKPKEWYIEQAKITKVWSKKLEENETYMHGAEDFEPVCPYIQDKCASQDNGRVSHYSPSGTHLPPLTSRTARSIFGSRFSSNANLPVAPSKSLILARVSRNFLRSVVVPDCSTA